MKRVGNLYHQIADSENLRLAFYKACRGKSDRAEVINYRKDLDKNLILLRQQLFDEHVNVGDYRFFMVFDPKKRQICAASFNERVLHHAVMNICEPVLDKYAIYDSYACRIGKGQQKAVKRAQKFAGDFQYYLKLDIRKYFDSIDQTILLNLVCRRIKDIKLLNLFKIIISSYHTEPGKGLPIGNLVSQHLANFYLGRLDHWLKEDMQVKGYVRYMDDFLLFATSKQKLKEQLHKIADFLVNELQLDLKDNIQLNRCGAGIPFLGFRIYPAVIRLSQRSGQRFRNNLRHYEALYKNSFWNERQLADHVEPLLAFTQLAATTGLRRDIIDKYGATF